MIIVKRVKKILLFICIFAIIGFASLVSIEEYVRLSTAKLIVPMEDTDVLKDSDYILILGAGLNIDGTPSPMLKERLDTGISLYKKGICHKIIVSGDHLYPEHDEVNSMKNYMTKEGIPSDDIYMDHAGISTYDSLYRAKELFGANRLIVVTQKYHLYRSLYIGKRLGIEVHGVDAQTQTYSYQIYRDIREFLARIKDFAKCFVKPSSKVLGDSIPVFKGGNVTNDKKYITIKSLDDEEREIYMNYSAVVYRIIAFLDEYEFNKRTCKEDGMYTMYIEEDRIYGIELADRVHIVRDDEEIILNDEDSQFFLSLLAV